MGVHVNKDNFRVHLSEIASLDSDGVTAKKTKTEPHKIGPLGEYAMQKTACSFGKIRFAELMI